ncbi:hypothetical protein QTP70_022506 [Hemibagrus guttatus]|uniref:Cornichon family AMPA receptor auxiliary protein 3 n=2 Tax=Siluroidei TaxID=1489793 RepID=A0AAE0QAB9_9TELE|nr:hypothetical protein QTP70_022506 [Hemibagrus guttatus]
MPCSTGCSERDKEYLRQRQKVDKGQFRRGKTETVAFLNSSTDNVHCLSFHQLVLPEYSIHGLFCIMFMCAQEWLTVGLNIPLLFYNTWRYFHSPTDTKELLYDPASVMNDDTLKFCQKEAWCKMSFFVLSFFYYLYWWVSTINTVTTTLQLSQVKLVFPPSRARITTEIRVRVPYGAGGAWT